MQLAIRVAIGSILIAVAGIPAFAQKTAEPTQKPTKVIVRETIVLCTVLPNGDVDDETPQNNCELGFDDGGGGGDSTTSTCSNDSSDSRSNCYPTNGPVGLGTGSTGGTGTRGTPIVSCQQLYQEAKARCRGTASCLSAALSAEEDCLRRSNPSGTSPTAHRPGSTEGQKPLRSLMVKKVSLTVKKQHCDKLQTGNTAYCNTTVKRSMPGLYGMCVEKTKESYDTCMLP